MNQNQGTQPKKSSTGLIIVIIVVVLIVLGVGGYFGWRYLAGKFSSQTKKASPSPVVTVTVTASVSPAVSPSLSASKAISGDYVIADSDTRVIREAEIRDFTPWQLKVARNEIYARHGRPFVHKDLQCYFATKSWYKIDENFTESSLSVVENSNVATIKDFEEKINSPMASKDTGC